LVLAPGPNAYSLERPEGRASFELNRPVEPGAVDPPLRASRRRLAAAGCALRVGQGVEARVRHRIPEWRPAAPRDSPPGAGDLAAVAAIHRCIVFGGSGNGEAIVANRVPGVRAPLCWNRETARLGREHNDANGLALGARVVDEDLALEIVRVWLDTPFEGGRHLQRIRKIDEQEYGLLHASESCPTKR
jgi:Ribose/Galactose Isomerase